MDSRWINIAKVGTFTDMHGRRVVFTPQILNTIAQNYDENATLAPLVIGHPEVDAPAYGWVKKLRFQNNYLQAYFTQVQEKIQKAVQSGLYKYGSMSLDSSLSHLRHFGLLGATAPAIEGLGEIEFARKNKKTNVNICFSDGTFQNFVDTSVKKGNVMDNYQENDVSLLLAKALEEIEILKREIALLKGEKEALEEKTENIEASFSSYKKATRTDRHQQRLNRLTEEGKVLPSEYEVILATVKALASSAENMSFAEGGQVSIEEKYWQELEKRKAKGLNMSFADYKPQAMKPKYNLYNKF